MSRMERRRLQRVERQRYWDRFWVLALALNANLFALHLTYLGWR